MSLPLRTLVAVGLGSWPGGGAGYLAINQGAVTLWWFLGKVNVSVNGVQQLQWENRNRQGVFRSQAFRLPWRKTYLWVKPLGSEADPVRSGLLEAGFQINDVNP